MKCKIVLIGPTQVGKTSIVKRFLKGQHEENVQNTISADFFNYEMNIAGIEIELKIWDTAGQDRFKSIGPLYYRDADAAIAVFDITDRKSLTELEGWIQSYRDFSKCPLVIVAGNKIDKQTDSADDQITFDEAKDWAKTNNAKELFMTSAKSGEGITELFESCAKEFIKNEKQGQSFAQSTNIQIADHDSSHENSCC